MSGRVIGFIVLTAILAIARAAPEDAETYVAAIGMGIIVVGWRWPGWSSSSPTPSCGA
jgi:hypothetical protein